MAVNPSSRNSGQRRPHRKSKNGCLQCKQKRIKCDEHKPTCGHCKRVESRCSFTDAMSLASSASDISATLSLSPRGPDPSNETLSVSSFVDGPLVAPHLGFEIDNLELLHYYTTTTSFTLSSRPELQEIWQQVVPQIAFTHHFLLHGILAFSALHLARAQPERKMSLYNTASAHHDIGLAMFRMAMTNITPQNSDACLAFSTLVAAYAWASSHQTADLFFTEPRSPVEPTNVEWASLLRGVHTLLDAAGEWMATSSLKMILHPRPVDHVMAPIGDSEASAELMALYQLWEAAPEKFDALEIEALSTSLALLQEDFELLASSSENCQIDIVSVVYGWPIKVPELFIVMVKEMRPEALIILAHYSLMLNKANHVWFMQGMSRRLLQTVHSKLEKEWEPWIAWPLQKLVLTEFHL